MPDVLQGKPQLVRSLAHANAVYWAAFSPDGKQLATACLDNTARLWDPATGAELAILRGHEDGVTFVHFLNDGRLLSASLDKSLKFWSADGALLSTLGSHAEYLSCAAVSPESMWVATGGYDAAVRLWDARSATSLGVLSGHTGIVHAVAFSPDGRILASAGDDLDVRLWDIETRTLHGKFSAHAATIEAIAFIPGTQILATAGGDGRIRFWDTTGATLVDLDGRTSRIKSLAFSRDGMWLASGGADGQVRLWHVPERREIVTIPAHRNTVYSLAFSEDGRFLVSAGFDRTVHLWSLHPGS